MHVHIVVLTVFDNGGLAGMLPGMAWTEADLRGGMPIFLAGDGCNGGTTSTAEELLVAAVVTVVVSAGLTSLVNDCL